MRPSRDAGNGDSSRFPTACTGETDLPRARVTVSVTASVTVGVTVSVTVSVAVGVTVNVTALVTASVTTGVERLGRLPQRSLCSMIVRIIRGGADREPTPHHLQILIFVY